LDALLARAKPFRRTAAAWVAARWAVDRVGLVHPVVTDGLSSRTLGLFPSVVDELDSTYFALQHLRETGQPELADEVSAAFARARAASAVAFAARGEPIEAVYEAGMAVNDWSALQSVVATALRDDA
jgi:hypothetical protein